MDTRVSSATRFGFFLTTVVLVAMGNAKEICEFLIHLSLWS